MLVLILMLPCCQRPEASAWHCAAGSSVGDDASILCGDRAASAPHLTPIQLR